VTDGRAEVEAVKDALDRIGAVELCGALNLSTGSKRTDGGRGVMVRCPWHDDRTPSCHVDGRRGAILAKCHSCGEGGDVLALVAAAYRLDIERDFREVLEHGARLGGIDLERVKAGEHIPPPARPAPPPRGFPPLDEVTELWRACRPVCADPEVVAWLLGRALLPQGIDRRGVARALPETIEVPRWARHDGRPWNTIGYRLLFPLYDAAGDLRSLRSRRVVNLPGAPDAKGLPASGYELKGLVMACSLGAIVLACGAWPEPSERRIVITEGEPDWLTWCDRDEGLRTFAALGIAGSGQWTQAIADRIPDGSHVLIRTDQDDAGDRYAEEVVRTLAGRCRVAEGDTAERAERRATRATREAEDRKRRERRKPEALLLPLGHGATGK